MHLTAVRSASNGNVSQIHLGTGDVEIFSSLLKVSRFSRNQVSRFTMASFGFAHAYASVSTIWSSKDLFFFMAMQQRKQPTIWLWKLPGKKKHDGFSQRIIHVLSLSSVICLLGYESYICSLLDNLHEPCRFLSYWMLSDHKTFPSARAHKADCHKPSVRHPGDHAGSGE